MEEHRLTGDFTALMVLIGLIPFIFAVFAFVGIWQDRRQAARSRGGGSGDIEMRSLTLVDQWKFPWSEAVALTEELHPSYAPTLGARVVAPPPSRPVSRPVAGPSRSGVPSSSKGKERETEITATSSKAKVRETSDTISKVKVKAREAPAPPKKATRTAHANANANANADANAEPAKFGSKYANRLNQNLRRDLASPRSLTHGTAARPVSPAASSYYGGELEVPAPVASSCYSRESEVPTTTVGRIGGYYHGYGAPRADRVAEKTPASRSSEKHSRR